MLVLQYLLIITKSFFSECIKPPEINDMNSFDKILVALAVAFHSNFVQFSLGDHSNLGVEGDA